MNSRTRRALFSAAIFLAACGVTGSIIGGRVAAQSASDESTLRDSMKNFTDVYALVEQNYADKFDTDHINKYIYDGAIPGMLHVLDPHSNFYDPKSFAQMREDQHGKYYGVGMQIQPQENKIVVLAPFEGTPAYKAGIRPGDVILAVDGKSTDNMDSAAVATMLKGPRGTHVTVTMAREGASKPLVFDLIRDEIPRYSVDVHFMIKPGIGYMHVAGFQETTDQEVAQALEPLLQDRNGGTRVAGVRAILVWCGPENVPALVKLLESDPTGFDGDECRKKAIDALVKLKDPRGAPAIARNWKSPFEREWTRRSLEALGPGAEDAVRPYLEDRDWGVRVEACRTLKGIGTRKSLPALEETLANTRTRYGGYRDVADAAREAISAIKARP